MVTKKKTPTANSSTEGLSPFEAAVEKERQEREVKLTELKNKYVSFQRYLLGSLRFRATPSYVSPFGRDFIDHSYGATGWLVTIQCFDSDSGLDENDEESWYLVCDPVHPEDLSVRNLFTIAQTHAIGVARGKERGVQMAAFDLFKQHCQTLNLNVNKTATFIQHQARNYHE